MINETKIRNTIGYIFIIIFISGTAGIIGYHCHQPTKNKPIKIKSTPFKNYGVSVINRGSEITIYNISASSKNGDIFITDSTKLHIKFPDTSYTFSIKNRMEYIIEDSSSNWGRPHDGKIQFKDTGNWTVTKTDLYPSSKTRLNEE